MMLPLGDDYDFWHNFNIVITHIDIIQMTVLDSIAELTVLYVLWRILFIRKIKFGSTFIVINVVLFILSYCCFMTKDIYFIVKDFPNDFTNTLKQPYWI